MNPLSASFGAGVALKNALYDRGLLKVMRLSRPVISVGNISVGGSGKTPFVIALGQLLKERGIAFDVLSRGYGRKRTAPAIVDPGGSPDQFGDEPLLMARKLQAPVIVAADRFAAGLLAEQQFSSQLHLLDDGFQHRRLHRDFDIVIIPDADFNDTLLPMGRLREPVSALARADAVILPGSAAYDENPSSGKNLVWRARRQMIAGPTAGRVIAFCGIARAGQFFSGLRSLGVETIETVAFPDHYRYRDRDIAALMRLKSQAAATSFLTTEKDLINLGTLADRLQPLQVVQISLSLEDPNDALSTLLATVERRSGCRFKASA
jgi:tetraacyldisaccharide 4'-kinase